MADDQEIIEAYLDGLLDRTEARALEQRLRDSAPLREELELARALRAALRQAKPEVPSQRMWQGIQARLRAEGAMPEAEQGSALAWLTRPWPWAARLGAAGAMALALVLVMKPWDFRGEPAPVAAPELAPALRGPVESAPLNEPGTSEQAHLSSEEVQGARVAPQSKGEPGLRDAAPSKEERFARSDRARAAAAGLAMAKAAGPAKKTEVERALEDTALDGMIQQMLLEETRRSAARPAARELSLARAPLALRGGAGAGTVAAASAWEGAASSDMAALEGAAREVRPLGRVDGQGFWDWRPAALAMNGRDWSQARAELELARGRAPEAAERAFAASALGLLSGRGGPLASTGFEAQPGPLLVQAAGRWQLLVEARQARYAQGVVARLPGWRAEGESLILDLSLDRGDFSPGTRFTRLAGEAGARLLDARWAALERDEVLAPRGASYSVGNREVRLR